MVGAPSKLRKTEVGLKVAAKHLTAQKEKWAA